MPRYIDAEKLTEAVREKCDRCEDTRTDFCSTRWCDIAKVIKVIDNAPTADVVEREKGKWIVEGHHPNYLLRCSACQEIAMWAGGISYIYPNFCPNCGADMREEKTDETD